MVLNQAGRDKDEQRLHPQQGPQPPTQTSVHRVLRAACDLAKSLSSVRFQGLEQFFGAVALGRIVVAGNDPLQG